MKAITLILALALLAPSFPAAAAVAKKATATAARKSASKTTKSKAKAKAKPVVKPLAGDKPKTLVPVKAPAGAVPAKTSASAPALSPDAAVLNALSTEDRLRLQVYLDRASFAPGKVDGLTGEFTLKAARRWISAQPDRTLNGLLAASRMLPVPPVTTFTIPADAARFIGTVPTVLVDKAAAKRLPYASFTEYLAERFHTDHSTLARLNPMVDVEHVAAGDKLRVPNVIAFKIESPRIDASGNSRVAGAQVHILHQEHMLEVRQGNGDLVAAFPITVGSKPEHVRTGAWRIMSLAANPTFMWDDSMLKKGVKGDKQYLLPPGPNNPVGVLWMELEPVKGPEAHIGIHGTNDPARIGRNQSSGCIRLANWDIVRLARLVGPGTRVAWKSTPADSAVLLADAR